MKINIISTLNNLTEKETIKNKTTGEKNKNKIAYKIDNDKYILKIISPTKIVLNRNNNEIENTLYYDLNKKTSAIYTIKKEGYTVEIDIKTTSLTIKDNYLKISYTVLDSNNKYEYEIETSEIK